MTLIRTEKIYCKGCGKGLYANIYDSINVTLNPEMKEMIIKGEINTFVCDYCKTIKRISSRLFYHDMTNNMIISVNPTGKKSDRGELLNELKGKIIPFKSMSNSRVGYIFDEVFSLDELIERYLLPEQDKEQQQRERIKNDEFRKPMNFSGKSEKLDKLRKKIIEDCSIKKWQDVWFYPEHEGVKGWMGT